MALYPITVPNWSIKEAKNHKRERDTLTDYFAVHAATVGWEGAGLEGSVSVSGEKSWRGDGGGGQEPEGQRSGEAGGKRGGRVLDREEAMSRGKTAGALNAL